VCGCGGQERGPGGAKESAMGGVLVLWVSCSRKAGDPMDAGGGGGWGAVCVCESQRTTVRRGGDRVCHVGT